MALAAKLSNCTVAYSLIKLAQSSIFIPYTLRMFSKLYSGFTWRVNSLKLKCSVVMDSYKTWFLQFRSGKRVLFIDCGANVGQAHLFFSKHYRKKWCDYILVEPNPDCIAILRQFEDSRTKLVPKGAWIEKGFLPLYGTNSFNPTSVGGTLVPEHNFGKAKQDVDTIIRVALFDFSAYVEEMSKSYGLIIVKLDIEASEYIVLERMIDSKIDKLVQTFYIEFHSKYFESPLREDFKSRELGITKSLKINSKVILWH